MNKILLILNGEEMSEAAILYAANFAKENQGLVHAYFLKPLGTGAEMYHFNFGEPFINLNEEFDIPNSKNLKNNIKRFKHICTEHKVNFTIHNDDGDTAVNLMDESIFADFIVTDHNTSMSNLISGMSASFLEHLLTESHCPVFIVPQQFQPIQNLILAYDGEASSTRAIKLFSYLFSELTALPTTLFSVNKNHSNHLKFNKKIKSLIENQYPNSRFKVLRDNRKDIFVNELIKAPKNHCVILGSYGGNSLSRMFVHSMIDDILSKTQLPVFVSHF